MEMDWLAVIGYIIAPITGIVTWIFSHQKRKNDTVVEMQQIIDTMLAKNTELYNYILQLHSENIQLLNENAEFGKTITQFTKQ